MSGGLNTEEDVTLGMFLLKLLHPLNQLLESGTSIGEHTILSEFYPSKIYGTGHMGFFGNVCAYDKGLVGNSCNPLILLLRLFILHSERPPFNSGMNVTAFETQHTGGAFFVQTSN
ncbi:hypothetical protein D3C74_434090 [compost metagenome]